MSKVWLTHVTKGALSYILAHIRQAGYFAKHFVLNASDYGVPQDRVRVYIVGFLHAAYLHKFSLLAPHRSTLKLVDVLEDDIDKSVTSEVGVMTDLFGSPVVDKRRHRKLSGMNDFFLFNDIRNGPTTIHSWDLLPTTERQKQICLLMLRNRRKRIYGKRDSGETDKSCSSPCWSVPCW